MQIETTRFGTIEVNDKSIVEMPDGMIGFEHCDRFVLLEDRPDCAFKWLQSVNDPNLAFIVINPLEFFADYHVNISNEEVRSLDLKDPSECVMFTTVTVDNTIGKATTNLVGPVVLNTRTMQARQIVLQDDRYCTKHVVGERVAEPTRDLAKAA